MSTLKKHKYLVISLALIVMLILWLLLILEGEYGTTLFFSIPASIGFLIGYSQWYNSNSKNDKNIVKFLKSLFVTLVIIAALSTLLIAIGIEGAICVLIAYPFLVIPIFTAYLIGSYVGKKDRKIKINSLCVVILFLINPMSYIYDSYTSPIEDEVKSELIIEKSSEDIWKALTSEITFKNKPGLLFTEGISYPKALKFIDDNPSFICYTNNDTITLDILKFNQNKSLKFKLKQQTIPMKEISPYDSINAKHLHNYLNVNYGEITLKPITKNKTKLIATTAYNYKIAPKWYWNIWTNYIIDEMHLHVLKSL